MVRGNARACVRRANACPCFIPFGAVSYFGHLAVVARCGFLFAVDLLCDRVNVKRFGCARANCVSIFRSKSVRFSYYFKEESLCPLNRYVTNYLRQFNVQNFRSRVSFPFLRKPATVIQVVIPLPLGSRQEYVRFVHYNEEDRQVNLSSLEFQVNGGIFAAATGRQPSVCPFRQCRVECAPSETSILRSGGPPIAVLRLRRPPLVRAIKKVEAKVVRSRFVFMKSVSIVKARACLPTFNSANQADRVVLPISLVDVNAFRAVTSSRFVNVLGSLVPCLRFLSLREFDVKDRLYGVRYPLSIRGVCFTVIVRRWSQVVRMFQGSDPFPETFRVVNGTGKGIPKTLSFPEEDTGTGVRFAIVVASDNDP